MNVITLFAFSSNTQMLLTLKDCVKTTRGFLQHLHYNVLRDIYVTVKRIVVFRRKTTGQNWQAICGRYTLCDIYIDSSVAWDSAKDLFTAIKVIYFLYSKKIGSISPAKCISLSVLIFLLFFKSDAWQTKCPPLAHTPVLIHKDKFTINCG